MKKGLFMLKYKIVATDLDGTLLNSDSKVSEENFAAIHALAEKGVHCAIATGRTLDELPKPILECEDIRYIIYSNGAMVLDKAENRRLGACIDQRTIRRMMDIFADYKVHISVRYEGTCYTDATLPLIESADFYRIDPSHVRCVGETGRAIRDFTATVRAMEEAEVFSVFFHSDEEQAACKARLEKIDGIYIAGICDTNFEIFNIDAGKDKALLRLADLLGVPKKKTMSLGDSGNDVAITKAAGLGLAVSNAQKILKDVADEIVCSNDEHVMQYVLEHYFGDKSK